MTTETNDLIAEVTQLPVQPGAAMRLLWMLEDPRTSAADLGRLIECGPTERVFTNPERPETEDYITGRFG